MPQPRTHDAAYAGLAGEVVPPLVALPRRLTPFLGREALVERVVKRIREPGLRLLTLTGPGGVGKTRLALQVAQVARDDFVDGTCFVSLAPVVDPALVLPEIGRSLGVTEGGDRPIEERLADALGGRRLLLVIDNLEQVLPAAPVLAELLRSTDGITILATSRAPLRIDGEHELAVPPLTIPARGRNGALSTVETEAVRFFLERARAVNPTLELTPSGAAAVSAIVRRLDGLPLALELAAARTKVLTPEALLVRLERQLHVLTGGPQDRPARQRTMRDTIAWSYGLLEDAEQALFRSLAVFRGGFSLEDAEAVLAGGEGTSAADIDILNGVEALVDQSLLTAADGDDGQVRFRMLETIREFGLEQLAAAGDADAMQARFARHWRALAEESWSHTAELAALNRALAPLDRNHDNIRAALDWLEEHDPAGAAELAGSLSWFWYVKGHHQEALRRLRRLLAMSEADVPPVSRPRLLLAAGWSSHFQGDTGSAVLFLEQGLDLWRARGDHWGIGFTLFVLGLIAEDTGAFGDARPLLHEAIGQLTAAGDGGSVASARYHLAVVAFGDGDIDRAEALLREVLDSGLGPSLRIGGWALHLRGPPRAPAGGSDGRPAGPAGGTAGASQPSTRPPASPRRWRAWRSRRGQPASPSRSGSGRWRSASRRSAAMRSTSRSGPSTRGW
jgi:predicted ATPase